MNKRFFIMLSIALLLAGFAALVAKNWIKSREVVPTSISVVVAAVEIPFGVKIEESQIKVIAWPGKTPPTGSFATKDKVINHITQNKFYPDEIITDKRISEYLGGSTLSALIAKDYRAISVRVDDVVGVSGFILPGNKVDVLATRMDNTTQVAKSRTLLQNIKVLAVDQEASQEKEKPAIVHAVTLELKPEQAIVMTQAMQEGKIQLTLRNPLDNTLESEPVETPPPPVVLPKPAAPPPPKPVIKKHELKVITW